MKPNIKSLLRTGLFILLLLIAVIFVWQLVKSWRSHQLVTSPVDARNAGLPIPVSTFVTQYGSLNAVLAVECVVQESKRINISSEVNGKVLKLDAEVGDEISAGQFLVKIDDSGFKEDLDNAVQAEKTLKTLKKEIKPFIEQMRSLRDKSLIPVTDLFDAIERLRRVDLDLVRINREKLDAEGKIDFTHITSPISGILTELNVEKGSVLRAFDNFAVIMTLDPLFLECGFPTDTLASIRDYEKASASFVSYPGESFEVGLDSILPVAKKETQEILAQFNLDNGDGKFYPGMEAVVRLEKKVKGLKVPAISLINPEPGSADIFIVDDEKKARLVKVKTGKYAAGYVEVLDGLTIGKRVVVVGQGALQEGDEVLDNIFDETDRGVAKKLFPLTDQK